MIFSPFERMMAWRYLRARKAEGFVSVIATFSFLGILLGVATLIIVMSVMNGFRTELVSRILGLNGHLTVYAPNTSLTNYDAMAEHVKGLPGVTNAFPMLETQALLTANNISTGVVIRGMKQQDFAAKPIMNESILNNETYKSDFLLQPGRIAIGVKLAERLNLNIGDTLVLLSPKMKTTPFGGMPRSKTFEVDKVFDVGMYEYNSGFVFITLEDAQALFQMPNAVTEIEVISSQPKNIGPVKEMVRQSVLGQADVHDWQQSNKSFVTALEVERNVMFLILTLIIIVAAFNIISSMIMLVKDKARDIAIMRTMGAARNSMLKIFMLTGASIGISGTLVGAVLGITFALNIDSIKEGIEGMISGVCSWTSDNVEGCKVELFSDEIYFLSRLPAEVEWHEVTGVVVMAIIISVFATLYPAWRAAKLDPVEALRYE